MLPPRVSISRKRAQRQPRTRSRTQREEPLESAGTCDFRGVDDVNPSLRHIRNMGLVLLALGAGVAPSRAQQLQAEPEPGSANAQDVSADDYRKHLLALETLTKPARRPATQRAAS